MKWARKQTGFTIVELLIVIVVIAILAAITIVAYNGIQNRAKASAVQSDISQAVKQLETAKITSGTQQYPSVSTANLKSSNGVTLDYFYNTSGNTYCVTAANGSIRYVATSYDMNVREGNCNVEDGLVAWLPMNGSSVNQGSAGGTATVNGASLSTGQNGQTDGAYRFTAGTNLFLSTVTSPLTRLSGAAWVYRESNASTPGLMQGHSTPVHWEITSGTWRLRLSGVDRPSIVDAGPLNTWSHVAFTYDRTTGQYRYYFNGERVLSINGDTGVDDYFSAGVTIGQSLGSGRQWLGSIDDFRLYNRALSDEEVKLLFSAGAR